MPEVNLAAMEAHLAAISERVSPGAHAVLVLDGAGWHSSPRLRVPHNILPIPATRLRALRFGPRSRDKARRATSSRAGSGAGR